jgi:hypothetical protein
MNGTIDDFRVYNRSLSAAQVLALYQNRSDRIVGQELSGSQNWTACVTPNDGSSDGSTTCSNGLFSFLAPRVTSLVVNSTSSLNLTSNNLTAHIVAVEANGNNVSFAYDWRLNGVSVAVVNLNFDVNNSAGSGMTKDFSTFNNHGTVSNATWAATGGWNSTGAYRFNGTHSYIDLGNDTELAVTRWTYAMWIYRNADSGTYERLLSKSNFTIYDRFLQISNVDTLQMGYVDTVGGGHFGESTATIATGRWYHVAGTFDGTYVRIYINGTLASTSSDFSSYTPRDSGLPISLGRLGLGSVWYYEFNGTMDDVRIYNRSLSAQQVRALYLNRSDTIVSDELNVTQNWTFCITPNNGANDGSTTCSAGHVINSLAPFLTSLVVNSTSGYNSTFENLTAYPTVADLDGSNFSLVYDWRLNGTSIAFINLNFDVNNSAGLNITRGYSTVGTNATAFNGALWNATGGWNGTGAYRFDGINDYLIANKSSVMNTPFTIMMRVKPTIYRAPSGCYYQGLVENTDWSFMMRDNLDCGGSGQLLLWNRTDGAWSSNLLPLNVWTHIAVTYNNSHVTIFWNGTLHTTTALKINTIGGGPYDFIIGDGTAEPFNGTIDDFRIYSRALSAAEILADYNGNPNILVSNELSAGNNWTVCVTGSDGTEYGPTSCSGTLLINSNGAPAITSLVMNSTNGLNRQTENLTAYASTSDPNSDNVSIAYDWRVNGSSIMLVNMNFDVNNSVGTNQTRDYTRWGNNGTAYNGARWNATGGWNNTGSYFFDGVDDYLRISNNSALDLVNKTNFTVTVWVKSYNLTAQTTIIAQQDANGTGRSWLYIVSNTLTSFIGGASTVVPTNMTKNMTFIALSFVENGTADNVSIYVNGVFANSSLQNGESTSGDIIIGGSKVLSNFFNGTIDDVRIYNRSLSAAQILAIYQNKSNLILSNELVLGQNWTVCATPNDGMIDGSTSCTSGLLILPPNTCTPTSTNWAVDCADNCSLANQAIALSGNLSVYGTGGKIEFSNVNITLDKFSNNASACTIAFKPPFIFARRSG